MKTFRRTVLMVGVAAATVGLGFGLASTSSGEIAQSAGKKKAKKSAFNPSKLTGTWTGSWKNQTFSTSGPAKIKLKVTGKKKKRKMHGTIDIGGNAFGCSDPDPRKTTLKKGKGKNRWNSSGFKAVIKNDNGSNILKYIHKKKKISGKGVSPCAKTITYSYKGTMTKKKVTAEVEISNNGEVFANSTLNLKKK